MLARIMGTILGDGEGRALTSSLLAIMIQGPIAVDEYLLTRNEIWKILALMRAGFRDTPPAAN